MFKVGEGISGHGLNFHSLHVAAVFSNGTALESLKVGDVCALTVNQKNC